MAQKRMFDKNIVDSDLFLDMPHSSQNLYFHLSMRADDEGFIANVKRIMRMLNSNDDDLRVLISKSFLLLFESGVVVIRHWHINNYLNQSRIKKTLNVYEKAQIVLNQHGEYERSDSTGLTNVKQGFNQYSIEESSIEQYRVEEDRQEEEENLSSSNPKSNLQTVSDFWQENGSSVLNQVNYHDLEHHLDESGLDIVMRALTIACGAHKPLQYAFGCIDRWKRDKLDTIEKIEKHNQQFQENKKAGNFKGNRGKVKNEPTWSNPDYEETATDEEIEAFKREIEAMRASK